MGLAGLPIGYTVAPRELAVTLRDQGLGDAERLGRLNMAAASAALTDEEHEHCQGTWGVGRPAGRTQASTHRIGD